MTRDKKLNILAIGAHYDDIELGCGGSIKKYVEEGHKVYMMVITDSQYEMWDGELMRTYDQAKEEGLKAAEILGVESLIPLHHENKSVVYGVDLIQELESYINKLEIDLIFTHWKNDVHQDHSAIGKATLNAGRRCPRILMYRSNWYKTLESFNDNFYIDISNYVSDKKESIYAHETEYKRRGDDWVDFVIHQNRNSGMEIGVEYAEAFECVKWLEI